MAKAFVAPVLAIILLGGCSDLSKSAFGDLDLAEPLQLRLPDIQPDKTAMDAAGFLSYTRAERDDYTLLWMAKSDELCAAYKARLIQASRDSRLASGLLAAVLGGLSTIFTPVGTVRALAGAASIANGTGAVFQSDAFNGQVGEILTAAIETARRNQANQIKKNLIEESFDHYRLFAALRDVIDYHRMCSLNTALVQVRLSLQATQPDGGLTAPARQGRQASGGISAPARAEVDRPSPPDPPNSLGQPRPQPLQPRSEPKFEPDGPPARLSEADMQALRPVLSAFSAIKLNVGNAQRANDPAFRDAVTDLQRCKGWHQTGFLTKSERTEALSGKLDCVSGRSSTPPAAPATSGG